MMKTLCSVIVLFCCVSLAFAQEQVTPTYIVSFEATGMTFYRYDGAALQEVERLAGFAQGQEGEESEWLVLSYDSLAVSPNREHIAFTARHGEDAALFIYTIANGSLHQQPIVSHWLMPLWSPDSGAVFLKLNTTHFASEEIVEIAHGYIYEIADSTVTEVYPRSALEFFAWLPDSSGLLYYGSCLQNDCSPEHSNFWFISRDGSEHNSASFRLPDDALHDYDIPEAPIDYRICNLTWSPFDQQWYYEYGCGIPANTPVDYLISSQVGLGLDLSRFQINPAERYSTYSSIVDIVSTPDAVYAIVESDYILADDYRGSWRILRIDAVPGLELVFDSHMLGASLQFASSSPDNQLLALVSEIGIYIVDLSTYEVTVRTTLQEAPRSAQWYDNGTLLYDTRINSGWGQVWHFNLQTSENVHLIGDIDHPAWLINDQQQDQPYYWRFLG